MTYRVTLSRTYDIEEKDIYKEFNIPDAEFLSDEDMETMAKELALEYMSDEMSEFIDNTSDFVSATVEKI